MMKQQLNTDKEGRGLFMQEGRGTQVSRTEYEIQVKITRGDETFKIKEETLRQQIKTLLF